MFSTPQLPLNSFPKWKLFFLLLFGSIFLLIYSFLFPRYDETLISLNGKVKKVLIPKNRITMAMGMRRFENKEYDFDGMLFILKNKDSFNTVNMKYYTLICSLQKRGKEYVSTTCKCVPPNVKTYNPNSFYVYEELFKDKDCSIRK